MLAFDAGLKARGLAPGTRRHHLNALSNLFAYALFKGVASLNPVADADEALWFEPAEAALFLEAARTLQPEPDALGQPPMPFAHQLVATYLLTDGRRTKCWASKSRTSTSTASSSRSVRTGGGA